MQFLKSECDPCRKLTVTGSWNEGMFHCCSNRPVTRTKDQRLLRISFHRYVIIWMMVMMIMMIDVAAAADKDDDDLILMIIKK